MQIANAAPCAPEENHLWPFSTQSSPSRTAVVWIKVGSEPATSGSVIEKQERARPSARGRRYFSFCSGVPHLSSVCMLPSSGAWALITYGPIPPTRAASAETKAIATGPSPMPFHSAGRCGFHSPRSLARWRSLTISSTYARRSAPPSRSRSCTGRTSSSMNVRTRRRTSSTSGDSVKSIDISMLLGKPLATPGHCSGRAV